HGVAIGVMLPHVIRFNANVVGDLYADLADDMDVCDRGDPEAPQRLAAFIEQLVRNSGAPTTLSECGVDQAVLAELAEIATLQWTARFNPRPVDAAAFEELYRCAM